MKAMFFGGDERSLDHRSPRNKRIARTSQRLRRIQICDHDVTSATVPATLGVIQVYVTQMGGGVRFSGKKRYEGVGYVQCYEGVGGGTICTKIPLRNT